MFALGSVTDMANKHSYRGSRAVDLKAVYWDYVGTKFLSSNGTILSDHNPISSNITWTRSSSLRQSDLFGGPHGYVSRTQH